jgi:hypothetical protein
MEVLMNSLPTLRAALARLALVLAVTTVLAAPASAQDAPATLSQAVREALTLQPPDSVLNRFMAELESGEYTYRVDLDSLTAMGMALMQEGETEKGVAVMGIASAAAQFQATAMFPEELRRAMEAPPEEAAEAEPSNSGPVGVEDPDVDLGPARDDLERFHGLYANPEEGPNRAVFLMTGCRGRLEAGAMWGDVAPWEMRSEGDTEFYWPGSSFAQPFRIEITVGPDGRGRTIHHDMDFVSTPLERIGELPREFVPRCERGR